MTSEALTEDIVKGLKPEDIIYAKFSAAATTHPNGTAELYAYTPKLQHFHGSLNSKQKDVSEGYKALQKMFEKSALTKYVKANTTEYINPAEMAKLDDLLDAVQVLRQNSELTQNKLLRNAAALAVEKGTLSTSLLQRHFHIDYGRAASIIDELTDMGILGDDSKHNVLISSVDEFPDESPRKPMHEPKKEEDLTPEAAAKIKPENIIYAEFAAGGAMGACGTARMYTLEGGTIHYYICTIYTEDESIVAGYDAICIKLSRAGKDGLLDYCYGGFGNHVYKKKDVVFGRDDEKHTLIYHDDADYLIHPSVYGVYLRIVEAFTNDKKTMESKS